MTDEKPLTAFVLHASQQGQSTVFAICFDRAHAEQLAATYGAETPEIDEVPIAGVTRLEWQIGGSWKSRSNFVPDTDL